MPHGVRASPLYRNAGEKAPTPDPSPTAWERGGKIPSFWGRAREGETLQRWLVQIHLHLLG